MATYTEHDFFEDVAEQGYKYGFVTDVTSEKAPKGLSEDTVRYISAQKEELTDSGGRALLVRPCRIGEHAFGTRVLRETLSCCRPSSGPEAGSTAPRRNEATDSAPRGARGTEDTTSDPANAS